MEDRFLRLPPERQDQIINGALDIFGRYEYKKATMDEVVERAGISKGLLYHYFSSKEILYIQLYMYCSELFVSEIEKNRVEGETDFFCIIRNSIAVKVKILRQHPSLFNFMLKAYYEKAPSIAPKIAEMNRTVLAGSMQSAFKQLDYSKFKPSINLEKAVGILQWCADGFMKQKMEAGDLDLDHICNEFDEYLLLLKQAFYKEESL